MMPKLQNTMLPSISPAPTSPSAGKDAWKLVTYAYETCEAVIPLFESWCCLEIIRQISLPIFSETHSTTLLCDRTHTEASAV
jgi:hypothetical protein